jgi:hypothetical protein
VAAGVDKVRDMVIASIMKLPVIGGLTQAEGVALGAYVTSRKGVKSVPDENQGIHGFFLDDGATVVTRDQSCAKTSAKVAYWSNVK